MLPNDETDISRAGKDYSARLARNDRFFTPLYQQIIDWLAVAPGSRVLDAGCGAGGVTALLVAAVGAHGSVTALDVAPAHLDATRELLATTAYSDRVIYQASSVEQLPFEDAWFDLAWCSHVVHGQPDQVATLRELRRVLVPGGRLALREDLFLGRHLLPDDAGIGIPGLEHRLNSLALQSFVDWRHALPDAVGYPFGWIQALRDAGFVDVTARTFVFDLLPPFTDEQRGYLQRELQSLREDVDLQAGLSDDDRRSLDLLTDPEGPHYALGRADVYFVNTATIYVGTVVRDAAVPPRFSTSS